MVFPRNGGQRRALIPVAQFNTLYYIAFHIVTTQFLTSDSSMKVLRSSKCSNFQMQVGLMTLQGQFNCFFGMG